MTAAQRQVISGLMSGAWSDTGRQRVAEQQRWAYAAAQAVVCADVQFSRRGATGAGRSGSMALQCCRTFQNRKAHMSCRMVRNSQAEWLLHAWQSQVALGTFCSRMFRLAGAAVACVASCADEGGACMHPVQRPCPTAATA
jgi:hypothetical protein